MIKRLFLTTALSAILSGVAIAQCNCGPSEGGWETSFVPGGKDPAGVNLHATEVRQFAVYGEPPSLYAATGQWMEQQGPKAARIIRLDSPTGQWVQEVDFGDGTTGGIRNLHWTADQNNKAVDVWTLVASIWSGATVFAKNTVDGKWYRTNLDPNGQIRSFATHYDAVAGEFWGFAGGKPGIFRGQLAAERPGGRTQILWDEGAANVELNTVQLSTSKPCSGGGRVTGIAEAGGRLFASACWSVYVRVDGLRSGCQADEVRPEANGQCQPRWKLFWTDEVGNGGESGLRGLTQIMHQGKQVLLIGSEQSNAMHVTRLDPDTGAAVVEFNAHEYLTDAWGRKPGYGILAYNSPMPLWYGPDGNGRRIMGFEVWLGGNPTPDMARKLVNIDDGSPQQMLGEGMFFVRHSAGQYELHHIPAITDQPMTAIRDCAPSPFADECNAAKQDCVLYCGGFDANKSTTQTPCHAAPCTFPPLVPTATHGTGFIVKGRVSIGGSGAMAHEYEDPHVGDEN